MTEVDTSRAVARERAAADTNEERDSANSTTTATAEVDSPSPEATTETASAEEPTASDGSVSAAPKPEEAAPAPQETAAGEMAPAVEETVAAVPGSAEVTPQAPEPEGAVAAEGTTSAAAADAVGAAPRGADPEGAEAAAAIGAGASPAPAEAPATGTTDEQGMASTAEPTGADGAVAEGASSTEAAAEEAGAAAAQSTEAPTPTLRPEVLPFVQALENKTAVRGKVIGWNKGGFHVSLDGVPAFCPKSQIEQGNPRKSQSYVDNSYDFRVIEIKEDGKRIVVSRAAMLAEERARVLEQLRQHQRSGEPLTGRVSSITDFGAFVDVGGGVEGLVHLTALSRQRVETPRDVVEAGQEVKVKVIKIEKGGDRISLSMKALEPDPWKGVGDRFAIGSKHAGKILRKVDFGLFVELEPGLEGLVHTSQLPLGASLEDASLAEGSEVEVWVREADEGRRRLSLAMREVAEGDPWKDIKERYEEGAPVKGIIEQVARFGVFVQLEPGLTALLPFSSVSLPTGSNPVRLYRPGEELEAQIAEIDPKRKRMSLAPVGTKLEGTKSDLREFQKRQKDDGTLNAMAAAFAKLQRD